MAKGQADQVHLDVGIWEPYGMSAAWKGDNSMGYLGTGCTVMVSETQGTLWSYQNVGNGDAGAPEARFTPPPQPLMLRWGELDPSCQILSLPEHLAHGFICSSFPPSGHIDQEATEERRMMLGSLPWWARHTIMQNRRFVVGKQRAESQAWLCCCVTLGNLQNLHETLSRGCCK